MTHEFSYIFFANETFDPTREYCPTSDGYRPGAVVQNVHMGEVVGTSHHDACNKLFEMFNINHPADYKNRSMSIGDVIMLTEGVTVRFFTVNGMRQGGGWSEIGDPCLHRNPEWFSNDDYFAHRDVYEQFRRERVPELFVTYMREQAVR